MFRRDCCETPIYSAASLVFSHLCPVSPPVEGIGWSGGVACRVGEFKREFGFSWYFTTVTKDVSFMGVLLVIAKLKSLTGLWPRHGRHTCHFRPQKMIAMTAVTAFS